MAGAPNFVVEVLSDTTARLDRNMKRKVYAATGVEELWLGDPRARTIEVFRLPADLERPAAIYQAADTFRLR
jgi:Uma2 family endonuclease